MGTSLLHHPAFFKSYRFLPHRLLNRAAAKLTALERPAWAVQAAIRAWSRLERIDLEDFEPGPYASLDHFFLRQLRPLRRPLGSGFLAPADGNVVATGTLCERSRLCVKGQRLSVDQIVNGGRHHLDLEPYLGGTYMVIFLTPRGYHHVHMPCAGVLEDVHWIPGRFYPQNEAALQHIPNVYGRNERAVLRARSDDGLPFLLVMVGASLIGGIHLEALSRSAWVGDGCVPIARHYASGDRIGHFAFGSTVVVLLPAGRSHRRQAGTEVRMGETMFE